MDGRSSQYLDIPDEYDYGQGMNDGDMNDTTETREGHRHHRNSIVQRVAERISSPDGELKKRRSRRSRRLSTSSALSQRTSIAAALAKSGLQVANPTDEPLAKNGRAVSTGRSPYLLAPHDDESDDGYGTEDDSAEGSEIEGIDHLPVTGFAVASNRRNAEFHGLFPTVDEGDYLIEGE